MSDGGERIAYEVKLDRDVPDHWDDPEWLRRTLGAIPMFIIRYDSEMRISYINQIQPGLSLDGVLGRSSYEFVAPEYHDVQRQAIERLEQTGNPQRYTTEGVGPDGTRIYYESVLSRVNDGSGDLAMMSFDVTEHVQRAEALAASEENLRLAIDATGLGLWSWNRETGEVSWNDRMHEITGRDEPVSPDRWIDELVHLDDAERAAGEGRRLPHRILRPDGERRWVLPVGDPFDSRATLVRGGLLDATTQAELEDRVRLLQRREAICALSAGVAHNFNNMLAVIHPAIELALRDAIGATESALSDALHATRRAAELVAQLMTYAGQKTRRKVNASVSDLIGNAVRMCRRTFDKQLELEVDVANGLPVVRADTSELEQLLLNLLINARDALTGCNDPTIRIEASRVSARDPAAEPGDLGSFVRIQVADNGIGMTKETLERIFEPFFSRKGPGVGTGLGLAMSQAIALEHGGWLAFESQLGEGTRAQVFLPPADGKPETIPPPSVQRGHHAVRVLVVEDESAVRGIVCSVLAELGHVVTSTDTAAAAAELLEAGGVAPDVVLLDRSMPGWPASRAAREIRSRAEGAKILFFTGQSVPPEEAELVDGVVHKPVSIQELERAILDCWPDERA